MPSHYEQWSAIFKKHKITESLLNEALKSKPKETSLNALITTLGYLQLDFSAPWQIIMLSGDLTWIQQELPNFTENTKDKDEFHLAYYAAFTGNIEILLFILRTFPELFSKTAKTGEPLKDMIKKCSLDYEFIKQEVKWIELLQTCNSENYNLDQALINLNKLSQSRQDKTEYQNCIQFHLQKSKRLLTKRPHLLDDTVRFLHSLIVGGIVEAKQLYIEIILNDFVDVKKNILPNENHPNYKDRTTHVVQRLRFAVSIGSLEAHYELGMLHLQGILANKSVSDGYRYFHQGAALGDARCQNLFLSPLKASQSDEESCYQLVYCAYYQKNNEYYVQAIEKYPKEFESFIRYMKSYDLEIIPPEFIFRFCSFRYQTDNSEAKKSLHYVTDELLYAMQKAKTPKNQMAAAFTIKKSINTDLYIEAVLMLADEFKQKPQIRFIFLTVISSYNLSVDQRAIVNSHLSLMPSTYRYLYPLPIEQQATSKISDIFKSTNSNQPDFTSQQETQYQPT